MFTTGTHSTLIHKQVSTFTFMFITQGSRSIIDNDKVIACVMSQFTNMSIARWAYTVLATLIA